MSRRASVIYRKVWQALRSMVDAHCQATGDTQEDIAGDLPVSYSTFNNYLCGHAPIPTDVFVQVTRLLGPDAMQEVASMCGGMFVPFPKAGALERESLRELVAQFQKVVDEVLAATAPDSARGARFSKDEADRLDEAGTRLQSIVERMKEEARADASNHERSGSLADAEGSHG